MISVLVITFYKGVFFHLEADRGELIFIFHFIRDYVYVQPERQVVEELAIPITYSLINEIDDAFRTSPVLGGFSIFNIHNVPDTKF